ncbi:MAG: Re/Si-specific NAD(P)(+) transhydrogenase subunit alpha [Acidobacteria bacterium]|nr:MAG: Re/Si-specific NAD(P)(+) transhydrogenase subunit alpha [Acidobacteriota bacterium]
MIVGVPKETFAGERRVALVPALVPALTKLGIEVVVEAGAGTAAGFPDDEYREKGARIAAERREVFERADLLMMVRAPGANRTGGEADLAALRSGQIVVGFADPLGNLDAVRAAAAKGISLLAMEMVPRITRAQSMDALSSMATISGYKAVLLAAAALPRMFPLMMTAAGTITPAHVFVVGAGVAGLQAIATSRKLGAVVSGYDVRPAVKEQVESLGGKFVELELETEEAEDEGGYAKQLGEEFYRKQREMMARVVADSDVVITTAAIPGKRSPVLVTEPMVASMRAGSVIVDLAAERGGNCELTRADEEVHAHGVTILGPTNLPSTVPYHASQMYSKNLVNLLQLLIKDGQPQLETEDEVIRGTLVTHSGSVVHPRIAELLGEAAAAGGNTPGKDA